jgi:hypothetical protein
MSWHKWSDDIKKPRATSKAKLHFFTQISKQNQEMDTMYTMAYACNIANNLGDSGQLFVPGLNRSSFLHDGSMCDDCQWVPDLGGLKRAEKEGGDLPKRMESNPTGAPLSTDLRVLTNCLAWPKVRYWQHSLNNMERLGIHEDDLCVMMDGMDVLPVADPEGLFAAYDSFFSGDDGIMFTGTSRLRPSLDALTLPSLGDKKCHPFCQEKGCWKYGNDYSYKMANGEMVRGEDMCERLAQEASGPAKYVCGGLFVGRCKLVRKMLNRVDDVIKEDGAKAGFFDQALYQIMQLRYPDLNIRTDSHMKYFSNWNEMGAKKKKNEGAETEQFEDFFGIKEADICKFRYARRRGKRGKRELVIVPEWTRADYRKYFGEDLLFVHFNGDAKDLQLRCEAGGSLRNNTAHGTWIAPELETVVNCVPDPSGALIAYSVNPKACDQPQFKPYCTKMKSLLHRRDAAMSKAWYDMHPFSHKRDNCGCAHDPCTRTCPDDQTRDPNGEGRAAYAFHPRVHP